MANTPDSCLTEEDGENGNVELREKAQSAELPAAAPAQIVSIAQNIVPETCSKEFTRVDGHHHHNSFSSKFQQYIRLSQCTGNIAHAHNVPC
jgi:hypothetical protein